MHYENPLIGFRFRPWCGFNFVMKRLVSDNPRVNEESALEQLPKNEKFYRLSTDEHVARLTIFEDTSDGELVGVVFSDEKGETLL